MKILMINVVCGIRSTGRICTDLATALEKQGHEIKIAYGRETVPEQFQKYAVRIGTNLDVKVHGAEARIFDKCGFGSRKTTKRFIAWVKDYDPDIIHIHNIHGYYINVEVLFNYLRSCGKKILWTLHDCWAFTGHAAYCEYVNCDRWISGCHDCPKRNDYPKSFFDGSKGNWKRKKDLFCGIPRMELITPSAWLANLIKKSYLKDYPIAVINNGVDTGTFKPSPSKIKGRLGIKEKHVILGVAALWEDRKGLNDFIRLSSLLSSDYKIVLVGLSKQQISTLPKEIIGIERTNSTTELAELYTMADVYVNPTYEDNYPTTNLEAIACGTPVITYNAGGSGESAEKYGMIVPKGDINGLKDAIENAHYGNDSVEVNSIMDMVNSYVEIIGNNTA